MAGTASTAFDPSLSKKEGPASAGPFSLSVPSGALILSGLRGRGVGPVDLVAEPGTATAILGPSGAGKSLLLRLIADLDPGQGEVSLGALRREAVPPPEWRRRVCLVPAEPGWWAPDVAAHFPAKWNVSGAAALGLPADIMTRAVATLSTGERQRLALLRALARHPDALLLDEPTAALDPASIAAVEALLREALAGGLVLVVVTHDAAFAARLCGKRHVMTAGRLAPAPG